MAEAFDPSQKIQELQSLEQNFQMFLHQKQNLQVELNEINNAEKEVKASDGEIYKTLSGVMIKADKEKVLEELSSKKEIASNRMKGIESQEKMLDERISSLREELTKGLSEVKK